LLIFTKKYQLFVCAGSLFILSLQQLAPTFQPLTTTPQFLPVPYVYAITRYFIENGKFEVTKDHQKVRVSGFGEIFGELALMYNARRAATVKALTKGKLWALHRKVLK
jgi:hypothetical protein